MKKTPHKMIGVRLSLPTVAKLAEIAAATRLTQTAIIEALISTARFEAARSLVCAGKVRR